MKESSPGLGGKSQQGSQAGCLWTCGWGGGGRGHGGGGAGAAAAFAIMLLLMFMI